MDNERPIEKLLRRFAKKRRDDAGAAPGLHPATRRLLQGEVARQFPQGRRGETPRSAGFWGRWKIAIATLAVLAVAAAIFLPSSQSNKKTTTLSSMTHGLQENSDAGVAKPMEQAASQPMESPPASSPMPLTPNAGATPEATFSGSAVASTTPPQAASVDALAITNGISIAQDETATATREQPAATTGILGGISAPLPSTPDLAFEGGEIAAAKPAPAYGEREKIPPGMRTATATNGVVNLDGEPATTDSFALKNTSASAAGSTGTVNGTQQNFSSQKFVNSFGLARDKDVAKSTQTARTPVLNNFSCEQNGNQLRVVDADGSAYSGFIESAPATVTLNAVSAGSMSSTQMTQNAANARQMYYFRVMGTNLTLNANVIFIGQFGPQTQAVMSQAPQHAAYQQMQNVGQQQQTAPFLQNVNIIGRARIGNGAEVEVNAVPVNQ